MEREPTTEEATTSLVIRDLAEQVANTAIDRAAWRARALLAEDNLAKIQAAAEGAEAAEVEKEDE